MRRLLFALPLLLSCIVAGTAWGQPAPYVRPAANPGNPFSRPIVSPYINLANINNSNGFNPAIAPGIVYAGIVQPELRYNRDIGGLQRGLTGVEANQFDQAALATPFTGHQTMFLNLSHYFGGSGGSGRGPGAVAPRYASGAAGQGRPGAGGGTGAGGSATPPKR